MKEVGKLRLVDMGKADDIKAMIAKASPAPLGLIIGSATSIIERTSDIGERFYGLKGTFEWRAEGDNEETILASQLYLPQAVINGILTTLSGKNAPAAVEFALNAVVVKSENVDGFSYGFDWTVAPRNADPLKSIRDEAMTDDTAEVEKAPAKAKK